MSAERRELFGRRRMSDDDELPDSVRAMLEQAHAPTAPLDEFIAAYGDDDNLWWSIDCGHHQNLFEAALEALAEYDATGYGRRVENVELPEPDSLTEGDHNGQDQD